MTVLICCNKKDFFLTKICVASIRYYYPDINLYLIKDYYPGNFSSSELERSMNVEILDLGIMKYGTSAAKMHLLLSKAFPGEKILVLDSDIAFVGRFLDPLYKDAEGFDFAVSPEYFDNPNQDSLFDLYYNLESLKKIDPEFQYPGYFFNGGQMLITTTALEPSEVIDYFDINKFPYYKRLDLLSLYDQGLLNYILPKKEQKGEIRILKSPFWVWSESEYVKNLNLEGVKQGNDYLFLIHWAGARRIPYLSKMTRPDILNFFESFYYEKVPFGKVKRISRKIFPIIYLYARHNYSKILQIRVFAKARKLF